MKTSIETRWQEKMAFISQVGKNSVVTDAPLEFGGEERGASPKKLMMVALAGCTGVDVVEILKKMRVEIDDLLITIEAELTDEVPSVYSAMHIIYAFKGKELDRQKLERAVELSQEKYCSVSMMYKKIMDITWEVRYQEQVI
ncbi:OsmC family protein [Desulfopila aestuarii]|uniref:Putative redox protein n=1 Tax=Desulfopila aestuarii DSM 18488 TaxID=1121416 RepID=A0A1M7YJA9_9BACT|nr:OsmC family protein [Desulfopila aestuarii]SHO52704.1 putative redox protein [Desulfopila aestuarii DSM 18488]